jgi:hypothetical protein
MARVEFRTSAVREHGFPRVCASCGTDGEELVPYKVTSRVPWVSCFLVFLGPLGLLIMVFVLGRHALKEASLKLPVCTLCKRGQSNANRRFAGFLTLGFGSIFSQLSSSFPRSEVWFLVGFGLCTYALIEYIYLSSQFRIEVDSFNSDRLVARLPNDDYPGLYERHLDNALLYGTVDTRIDFN